MVKQKEIQHGESWTILTNLSIFDHLSANSWYPFNPSFATLDKSSFSLMQLLQRMHNSPSLAHWLKNGFAALVVVSTNVYCLPMPTFSDKVTTSQTLQGIMQRAALEQLHHSGAATKVAIIDFLIDWMVRLANWLQKWIPWPCKLIYRYQNYSHSPSRTADMTLLRRPYLILW